MTYFVRRNAEKLPSIFLAVCKQEETNKGREPRKPFHGIPARALGIGALHSGIASHRTMAARGSGAAAI